jgi:hypothetical protein
MSVISIPTNIAILSTVPILAVLRTFSYVLALGENILREAIHGKPTGCSLHRAIILETQALQIMAAFTLGKYESART